MNLQALNLDNLEADFFKKNTFIEASAGTGKTYTIQHLVLKIIGDLKGNSLVLDSTGKNSPVKLDEILLLTYTDKAAGELRSRIRAIIEEKIEDPNLTPEEKAVFEENLQLIDNAPIQTFHSFCDRVSHQYSFETNNNTSKELIDNKEINNVIDRYCRDTWPHERAFQELVQNDKSFDLQELIKNTKDLLNLYHPENSPFEYIKIDAKKILSEAQKMESSFDFEFLKKINFDAEKMLRGYGPKSYEKDLKKANNDPQILELLSKLFLINNKTQDDLDKKYNNKLLFLNAEVPKIYEAWANYKEKNSLKTYDDIIEKIYTHTLNEGSLVKPLRNSYRYAIIDEFQDTNFFQWSIFKNVFLNSKSNRLIVVGDPKQSIYSFQGANLEVYKQATSEIQNGYRLDTNYRSSKTMIKETNKLFHFLFNHPKEHALFKDSKSPDSNDKAIFILEDKGTGIEPKENDALLFIDFENENRYAEECAKQIEFLLQHGEIRNQDKKENIKLGDIAILSRTRSEMTSIERALQKRNLPYTRYKDDSLFNHSIECFNLAVFLKAIHSKGNSSREQSLKRAALISPFVGKNLDEALEFDFDDIKDPLNQDFLLFSSLIYEKKWTNLFEMLFLKTKIEDRLIKENRGIELTSYKQIIEYCLEVLIQKQWPLDSLIQHLFNLYDDKESPLGENSNIIAKDTDKKIIQIMTIHASKGLEFPIVFLHAGFKGKSTNISGDFLKNQDPLDNNKYKIYSKDTHEIEKNKSKKTTIEEHRRLFYVAMTRAKHLLVLPKLPEKLTKDSPFQNFLYETLNSFLEKNPYPSVSNFKLDKSWKHNQEANSSFDLQKKLLDLNNKFTSIKEGVIQNSGALYTKSSSYSQLAHQQLNHSELGRENKSEEESPTENPLLEIEAPEDILPKGAHFGNAIHNVFEDFDFSRAKDLDLNEIPQDLLRMMQKHFEAESLEYENMEHLRLSFSLIKNTLLAQLPKVWQDTQDTFSLAKLPVENQKKEMQFNLGLPFSEQIPNWFFNGFIDLVFIQDSRYCILDWKTDFLEDYSHQSLEKAIYQKKYSLQRALYTYTLVEWLSTLIPDISKESIYEQYFGAIYYVFVRGTQANTSKAFHSHRYSSYQDLVKDLDTEVLSKLKNIQNKGHFNEH